jgi:hypothetical protein
MQIIVFHKQKNFEKFFFVRVKIGRKNVLPKTSYITLQPFHSGPFFIKKLQKLIILDPVHIFLFPIQGKCKIARVILKTG